MRSPAPLPVRLLTHNIRYATSSPFQGEQRWDVRRPHLINELRFNTAYCSEAFICLQEVLHGQLVEILSGLNETKEVWDYIGDGRDDGEDAGEYSPIIYQSTIWALQSYKTVWLSETPDRPSKGWDAASVRILTVGVFQHRESKKVIVAMNTHLDDQGSRSRLEAVKIILEQIALFSKEGQGKEVLPVFLAGDFNSEPDDEAYKFINSDISPMYDLQSLIPKDQRYGNLHTFTGFEDDQAVLSRIDFLFINLKDKNIPLEQGASRESSADRWAVEHYGILGNRFEDELYISDHRAVIGDVVVH